MIVQLYIGSVLVLYGIFKASRIVKKHQKINNETS
jgi:hypothetical protein